MSRPVGGSLDLQAITATGLASDEGSVLLLDGLDVDGEPVLFACDRRPGSAILEALEHGEDAPVCWVPDYLVLR